MTSFSSQADVSDWLHRNRASARPTISNTDKELLDVLGATVAYVQSARQAHKLADTATVTLSLPYEPQMRALWEAAEPLLAAEYIGLDWSRWQIWTIERSTVGDDWDPEPFVFCRRGEYRVGFSYQSLGLPTASVQAVEPDDARRAAARLLAIAELAERKQTEALEGKQS